MRVLKCGWMKKGLGLMSCGFLTEVKSHASDILSYGGSVSLLQFSAKPVMYLSAPSRHLHVDRAADDQTEAQKFVGVIQRQFAGLCTMGKSLETITSY